MNKELLQQGSYLNLLYQQLNVVTKVITDNEALQTQVRYFINPDTNEYERLAVPKLEPEVYQLRDNLVREIRRYTEAKEMEAGKIRAVELLENLYYRSPDFRRK